MTCLHYVHKWVVLMLPLNNSINAFMLLLTYRVNLSSPYPKKMLLLYCQGHVTFGKSTNVTRLDRVFTIGCPHQLQFATGRGHVTDPNTSINKLSDLILFQDILTGVSIIITEDARFFFIKLRPCIQRGNVKYWMSAVCLCIFPEVLEAHYSTKYGQNIWQFLLSVP